MPLTYTATNETTIAWASWNGNTSGTDAATQDAQGRQIWIQWTAGTTMDIPAAPSGTIFHQWNVPQGNMPPARDFDLAAMQRAERLLRATLTLEQQRQFEQHGWFDVEGSAGGRYRILTGYQRNVQRLGPDGRPTHQLCAHPTDVPDEDAMLAQKLLLEADEAAFSRIANVEVV